MMNKISSEMLLNFSNVWNNALILKLMSIHGYHIHCGLVQYLRVARSIMGFVDVDQVASCLLRKCQSCIINRKIHVFDCQIWFISYQVKFANPYHTLQSRLMKYDWKLNSMRYREREMFYLTTHSTHFIYGYMASDIWLRTILIMRKETRCHHIGYSYPLTARVLLYAPSHRQDNTYHGLCYTSRGALAGTRNSSMGPPHEGSIRRPIAPWANALPLSYVPLLNEI